MKERIKKIFSRKNLLNAGGAAAVLILFAASRGFSANIKLNPIKPTAQNQAITDEQQGILAVRGAKASVVNIVGNKNGLTKGDLVLTLDTISGTGFILDSDGLIVSNSHVVQDPSVNYTVVFADGTQYDAKVLGLDKYNDVALLKIEATGLPVAKLGDSDSLETGQTVFAIGNSLGKYQNSVTRGVVSGLGRDVAVGDDANPQPRLQHLIQTDAAINLGNSGGPLINLAGEVVGINTLIDTEGQGLGFAVPANVIKNSIDQLKAFGKVSKPYAGVKFVTLNKAEQTLKQLDRSDGAYVDSVTPGSPAFRAGLRKGDIITEINREKLNQANELDNVINKYQAGTQVLVTFFRSGERMDAPLILAEFK